MFVSLGDINTDLGQTLFNQQQQGLDGGGLFSQNQQSTSTAGTNLFNQNKQLGGKTQFPTLLLSHIILIVVYELLVNTNKQFVVFAIHASSILTV